MEHHVVNPDMLGHDGQHHQMMEHPDHNHHLDPNGDHVHQVSFSYSFYTVILGSIRKLGTRSRHMRKSKKSDNGSSETLAK